MPREKDSRTQTTVTMSPELSTRDGFVHVNIERYSIWPQVNWNRHAMRSGLSVVPKGGLPIDIPVEGVKEGESLSPEQFIALIKSTFGLLEPMCKNFIEQADSNFEFDPEQDF